MDDTSGAGFLIGVVVLLGLVTLAFLIWDYNRKEDDDDPEA